MGEYSERFERFKGEQARVPSLFGPEEEAAQKRIGKAGTTLQIRPRPPVPLTDNEFSSEAQDEWFNAIAGMDTKISAMDKKIDSLIEQAGREWQAATNTNCDASGNIGISTPAFVVYEHKEGYEVDITQVMFWLDGQTPAQVFSTANAYAIVYKNQPSPTSIIAYSPQPGSSTVFPLTINIPNDVPPVLRMNDKAVLVVGGSVGGLANKNITVILNGTIKRSIV